MSAQGQIHEKGAFSFQEMIDRTKAHKDFRKAGAIASFIGVVRGETKDQERVQKLILEAYEEKANEVLAEICKDLQKRPGIVDVQIHHFIGEVSAGEDLVYVLVAGAHRKQVFRVLEEAVERYKKEAPIFKKECVETAEGETKCHWIAEGRRLTRV